MRDLIIHTSALCRPQSAAYVGISIVLWYDTETQSSRILDCGIPFLCSKTTQSPNFLIYWSVIVRLSIWDWMAWVYVISVWPECMSSVYVISVCHLSVWEWPRHLMVADGLMNPNLRSSSAPQSGFTRGHRCFLRPCPTVIEVYQAQESPSSWARLWATGHSCRISTTCHRIEAVHCPIGSTQCSGSRIA